MAKKIDPDTYPGNYTFSRWALELDEDTAIPDYTIVGYVLQSLSRDETFTNQDALESLRDSDLGKGIHSIGDHNIVSFLLVWFENDVTSMTSDRYDAKVQQAATEGHNGYASGRNIDKRDHRGKRYRGGSRNTGK